MCQCLQLLTPTLTQQEIDYVIPGNDDAVKGIQLLLDYFTAAVAEGAGSVKVEEKPAKKEEK